MDSNYSSNWIISFTELYFIHLIHFNEFTLGYLLRVPPHMKTCKQAVAWTFGLEEIEYNPVKET